MKSKKKFEVKERIKAELLKAIEENKGYQFRYGRPFYHDIEIIAAKKAMKEPTYTSKITGRKRKGIRLKCNSVTFTLVLPDASDNLMVAAGDKGVEMRLYDPESRESGDLIITNDQNIIKLVNEAHERACEYLNILRLAYVFYNPATKKKNQKSKLVRRAYPYREYELDKELRVKVMFQRPLEHVWSELLVYPTGEVYENKSIIRRVTTVVPVFLIKSEKGAYRRPKGRYAFKLYLKTRASLFYLAELHNEFYKFFIRYVSYKLKQKRYIFKKARELYSRILEYYREKYYDEHGHYPF